MYLQDILNAYHIYKPQGFDGDSIADFPIEELESDDSPDPCQGTGSIDVKFGGTVIHKVPCPRCFPGG